MARSATRMALSQMQPIGEQNEAALFFDGTKLSQVDAAFANASMIDSFDAHDGHAGPMGHAGVALLPALLAFSYASKTISGRDFLASLVVGYEVGLRAGIARTDRGASPLARAPGTRSAAQRSVRGCLGSTPRKPGMP